VNTLTESLAKIRATIAEKKTEIFLDIVFHWHILDIQPSGVETQSTD